jgi:hypothetical protein
MSILILIAVAIAVLALAPKCGTEDRPYFDERRPLA